MSNFFEIKSIEDFEDKNQLEGSSQKKRTSEYMTKYEYTRLIASRAVAIDKGFPSKVDAKIVAEGNFNPYAIARKELHDRVIPLVIERTLQDGTKEIWHIKDMHIRDY